jgi:hypothetical protein
MTQLKSQLPLTSEELYFGVADLTYNDQSWAFGIHFIDRNSSHRSSASNSFYFITCMDMI